MLERPSGLAAILNAMLLPAAVTYVRQNTVYYPSTDFSVRYSNVTISRMGLQSLCKIVSAIASRTVAFIYIGGTVGPSQQQLGFLFSKMQVAFMYAYRVRQKKWTPKFFRRFISNRLRF